MPRMIFVNLPVANVEKSAAFYEALGFTKNEAFSEPDTAASMVWSDTITLMLLSHDYFRSFLPAGKSVSDAHTTTEALLCLSFDSRDAVDEVTEAAARAGGRADPRPKQDHGFMYGRSFEDLDGHIYEPMWMDVEAALSAQPGDAASA